jgi:NADH dehydrogenase/NADH:ubiquinone oxidoreductase subunit G
MPLDRNDPEVKALIEEVTTAATEALAAKNRELLGEVKTLKAKAKGADIDPAEHAALQSSVEELSDKLAKAEKTSKSEIEKLTKALSEKDGALSKHLIDAGLTDALVKAGVKPEMLDAVKALHQSKASINAKDGAYEALIEGKPLAEFVTTWAQSDQGKHFVAAKDNAGGGSQGGGNGKGSSKTMTRAEHDAKMAAGDPSLPAFFKEGGKVIDS